ncbi:MAG: hypothetical protein ABIP20_13185 [Chthoniobacteraceae bacterium]
MNEKIRTLTLKCPSCGAALDVSPDMERFACGYCGTEQIVQRRGGTVSLKLISDAISRVQTGTDRTAAELALVRLQQELAVINAQLYPPSVPMKSLSGKPMAQMSQPPVYVPPEWKGPNGAPSESETYMVPYFFASCAALFFGIIFGKAETPLIEEVENYAVLAVIILVWIAFSIYAFVQFQRDSIVTERRRQSYITSLTLEKERILAQIAGNKSIVAHSRGYDQNVL